MVKQRIVDFHTHAFPDALAARAMAQLHSECDVRSYLDGRLSSLLGSMDRAGIDLSVLCCIATRPAQFEPILNWCQEIRSERIVPFPSVHPTDPDAAGKIEEIRRLDFKGIKLHPYYQEFVIDDPGLNDFYKAIVDSGLLLVVHTGYDIAFERMERASPMQILRVLDRFPDLRLVTTHLGGWFQWDEVEKYLVGRPIYMETSVTYEYLGSEAMKRILEKHDPDYLLFGTDSPWDDQLKAVGNVSNLIGDTDFNGKLWAANALKLLDM